MDEKEIIRIEKMLEYENKLYEEGNENIAGVDEAGRGPLFGPVVAAAVILPKGIYLEGINDSKKLTEKKREKLYKEIKEKAISYSIGIIDNKVIDKINILEATRLAMKKAIEGLSIKPDHVLIDAEKKVDITSTITAIIKGDSLSQTIAAASIIAKVTRDKMICEYDKQYPEYGLAKHKGYGTRQHTEAIKKYGITDLHRTSFCSKFI